MKIIKEINKWIIKSVTLLSVGLLALFIGHVFNFDRDKMESIAMGLIPLSIGMMLIGIYSKKNPKLLKNFELEREERNTFINTKARVTASLICYGCIFIFYIFQSLLNITLNQFLIFILILAPTISLIFTFVYHKKY